MAQSFTERCRFFTMANNRRSKVLRARVGAVPLGLGGFAPSATALTVNSAQTLTHVASFLGNVPSGVNVSASCQDGLVPGGTKTKSVVLPVGGRIRIFNDDHPNDDHGNDEQGKNHKSGGAKSHDENRGSENDEKSGATNFQKRSPLKCR
jgi:hypothetical protein